MTDSDKLLQYRYFELLVGTNAKLAIDRAAAGSAWFGYAITCHPQEDAWERLRSNGDGALVLRNDIELLVGANTKLAIDRAAAGAAWFGYAITSHPRHPQENIFKLNRGDRKRPVRLAD